MNADRLESSTLDDSQRKRLARMHRLAHRLDGQWHIGPIRIGYDSVIGLVPVVGDVLTALIALSIINNARKLGVPFSLLIRMLLNVGAEMFVGQVPVFGDLLDVLWRANLRNVALVEKHLGVDSGDRLAPAQGQSGWVTWLVAALWVAALVVSAYLSFMMAEWLWAYGQQLGWL